MLWRCSRNTLGCFDNALGVLWAIQTLGTFLQGLPGSLCIFEVFIVSRDTQSNLGFSRTKPLFPDGGACHHCQHGWHGVLTMTLGWGGAMPRHHWSGHGWMCPVVIKVVVVVVVDMGPHQHGPSLMWAWGIVGCQCQHGWGGLSSSLTWVMWHAVIVETMWVGWLSLSMTILFTPPLISPGFWWNPGILQDWTQNLLEF